MSPSKPTSKITIWIWPTGLFPRRLVYYLRAKHITLSALRTQNIHLIPVILNQQVGLVAKENHEARPSDSSLPCMRIETLSETIWIHESLAIIGLLEEIFSPAEGYPDIYGSTAVQRAKTQDILSLLADASPAATTALIHSDPSTTFWSGLKEEQMAPSAAAHAKSKFEFLLERLGSWVNGDVVEKETESLAGEGGRVTLADVALMASVAYAEDGYGKDWIEGCQGLRVWCERAKGLEWYVGLEELKRCESEGWEVVLGQ